VNDLPTHFALFAAITLAITGVGALYAERDDAKAFRSLPRRFVVFFLGCALVAAIMLFVEHTFAWVE
jgi:hypothetical protein